MQSHILGRCFVLARCTSFSFMVPPRVSHRAFSLASKSGAQGSSRGCPKGLFLSVPSFHVSSVVPSTVVRSPFLGGYHSVCTPCRQVQYSQTSQTMNAINGDRKGREAGLKWITRSTKEYMKEGDLKQDHAHPSLKADLRKKATNHSTLDHRERYREVRGAAEGRVERELVRIRDDRGRRWKKSFSFFKRQGKAFILFYFIAYFGTLGLLYLGFASNLLKKEAAFEYLLFFLGGYIDKEWFYERVEAWDGRINFGFAFVINELLEMVRFPLVMFIFYQLRPLIGRTHRGMRKSIFRLNAAEV